MLSWHLSNTMDAQFCVDYSEEALRMYGTPCVIGIVTQAQTTAIEGCKKISR